jgi:hypothetical protein
MGGCSRSWNDESPKEYLDIQQRAGEHMEGSGELAALVLKEATAKYRKVKQKPTGKKNKKRIDHSIPTQYTPSLAISTLTTKTRRKS